ncbi:hypothetical protein, partial [Alistipes putredinis]|uniref:hypothetical protein n=1 Tax=Alistipes putredinis TaxID=28117 RepID=UPI003AAFF65F
APAGRAARKNRTVKKICFFIEKLQKSNLLCFLRLFYLFLPTCLRMNCGKFSIRALQSAGSGRRSGADKVCLVRNFFRSGSNTLPCEKLRNR